MSDSNLVQLKKCPFCAEDVLYEARKCKHCGELLDPSLSSAQQNRPPIHINNYVPPTPTPAKPRVAYVLLGIFLGSLGIHNFYAGYAGRGVVQLLITLLTGWLILPLFVVWIWVLVEVCSVTTDASGVRFS